MIIVITVTLIFAVLFRIDDKSKAAYTKLLEDEAFLNNQL